MDTRKAVRLTCIVYKDVSPAVEEALHAAGVTAWQVQSGRAVVLRERRPLGFLAAAPALENDPVDVFHADLPAGDDRAVLAAVVERARLNRPGRGSVFTREIGVAAAGPGAPAGDPRAPEAAPPGATGNGLTGICCIVQRGEAETIVASVLEMGLGVPCITYGEGTGLRDKLGLLRIAIPAQKDVLGLVVATPEAAQVMDLMIDVGRLDLPGRGFVYSYPVRQGHVDTRFFRGTRRHAASMEQVIGAMDELKGGTSWRHSDEGGAGQRDGRGRRYLGDMVGVSFSCNEGHAAGLVQAAMGAGAAGATIGKMQFRGAGAAKGAASPARETADLVIAAAQTDAVCGAVLSAAAATPESAATVVLMPVPRACTYLGR